MTDEQPAGRLSLRAFRACVEAVLNRWLDLDPRERVVLVALLNHANTALLCWPGRSLVAAECGMSEPTFYRWRDRLAASGWILVEQREHQSSVVSLLPLVERLSDSAVDIPEHVREVLVRLVERATRFSELRIGEPIADSQPRESAKRADSQRREQPILSTDLQKDEELLRSSSSHSKGECAFSAAAKNAPPAQPEPGKVLTLTGEPFKPATDEDLEHAIFRYWQVQSGSERAQLDSKRRNAIRRALSWGYTAEELMTAVAGCCTDPWYSGDNDRHRRFVKLTMILRDCEKIDELIELAKNPRRPRSKAERRTARNVDAAQEFLRRTDPEGRK